MKELELEYRNAISLEVPDLWSRIEAGVDEYEASKKKVVNISDVRNTKVTETESGIKENVKKDHRKALFYIKRISAVAASLLVLIVVVKVASISKSSASYSAEAPMADAAASEAAAPAYEAESAADESFDEAPMAEEPAAEYAAEAEESAAYENSSSAAAGDSMKEDSAEHAAEAAEASDDSDAKAALSSNLRDTTDPDARIETEPTQQYKAEQPVITSEDPLCQLVQCEDKDMIRVKSILLDFVSEPVDYSLYDDMGDTKEIKFTDAKTNINYVMFIRTKYNSTEYELELLLKDNEDQEVVYSR